jgi:hypothetical protein
MANMQEGVATRDHGAQSHTRRMSKNAVFPALWQCDHVSYSTTGETPLFIKFRFQDAFVKLTLRSMYMYFQGVAHASHRLGLNFYSG